MIQNETRNKHYNRLREVILNKDNTHLQLQSIKRMVKTFSNRFNNNLMTGNLTQMINNK